MNSPDISIEDAKQSIDKQLSRARQLHENIRNEVTRGIASESSDLPQECSQIAPIAKRPIRLIITRNLGILGLKRD